MLGNLILGFYFESNLAQACQFLLKTKQFQEMFTTCNCNNWETPTSPNYAPQCDYRISTQKNNLQSFLRTWSGNETIIIRSCL